MMKTNTFFRRFKTNFFHGVKITVWPLLLIDTLIALLLAKGLEGLTWDIDFVAGLFISSFTVVPYVLITFVGITFVSLIFSTNRKFSNNAAFLMGGLVGIIAGGIIGYVEYVMWFGEFISLPSITTVILLAFAGQKTNSRVNQDAVVKTPELQMAGWLGIIAFIGSIVYVSHQEYSWDFLTILIQLGYVLAISLPSAIVAGFLIGFLSRKIPRPAFMKSPAWLRMEETIRWFFESVKRMIGKYPVPKLVAFLLLLFGIYSGIVFLALAIPSSRELWRIRDNNLSDPILVNGFVLFKARKGEYPSSCEYIYAIDKDTGKPVWSSESITDQYCNAFTGSSRTGILQQDETQNIL